MSAPTLIERLEKYGTLDRTDDTALLYDAAAALRELQAETEKATSYARLAKNKLATQAQRIADLEQERERNHASYHSLLDQIDAIRKGNGRSYTTVLTGEDGYVTVDVTRQQP